MIQPRRKALILTYYWPPAGGSGVQRWLKFTKYLGEFGWDPVIYTAMNPEAPGYDPSLERDVPEGVKVIRRRAIEPHSLFRIITGTKGSMGAGFASGKANKSSWLYRLSMWIRANLFIPDARAFWVKPSIRFLSSYLRENPVDIVISTGPPHSMHLIALGIKAKLGIPWLADFRDPWTNINYFQELPFTKTSIRKHKRQEEKVIKEADCVVVVSNKMREEYQQFQPKRLEVITNGYDETDFNSDQLPIDDHFSITHIGTLPANANCVALWEGLDTFVKRNPDVAKSLRINFVGQVDEEVISTIKSLEIRHLCNFLGYIPHNKAIDIMLRAQVLLLIITDSTNSSGILTGKVFEYLAAKRPILATGTPQSDVEMLLRKTQSGWLYPFNDREAILEGIELLWNNYKSKNAVSYRATGIESYSRRNLTKRVCKVMEELVVNHYRV